MREGRVWVAVQDGLTVGTVGGAPRGKALYIRGMAVLPEARGQGIGELLLDSIEQFAIGHGYQRLFLSTTPFLTRAIRLYAGQGFRRMQQDQQSSAESSETDSGPHDLFGTPLFTMAKDLVRAEVRAE
jgi:GNAT superfamily N-acetyltransferase